MIFFQKNEIIYFNETCLRTYLVIYNTLKVFQLVIDYTLYKWYLDRIKNKNLTTYLNITIYKDDN